MTVSMLLANEVGYIIVIARVARAVNRPESEGVALRLGVGNIYKRKNLYIDITSVGIALACPNYKYMYEN